jgi:hypothetical protein
MEKTLGRPRAMALRLPIIMALFYFQVVFVLVAASVPLQPDIGHQPEEKYVVPEGPN